MPYHVLPCLAVFSNGYSLPTPQLSLPIPSLFHLSDFPVTLYPHHVMLNARYCRAHHSTVQASKSSQVKMQSMWVRELLHQRTYWGLPYRNTTRVSHILRVRHITHALAVTSHTHTHTHRHTHTHTSPSSSCPPSYPTSLPFTVSLLCPSVHVLLLPSSFLLFFLIFLLCVCSFLRCVQYCRHH